MPVGRVVAAADVPALDAPPQVDPPRPDRKALHAPHLARRMPDQSPNATHRPLLHTKGLVGTRMVATHPRISRWTNPGDPRQI